MSLTSTFQENITWLSVTPDGPISATTDSKPTEIKTYDEVYRQAEETAESLTKMLREN
jgi:hypothetical protein